MSFTSVSVGRAKQFFARYISVDFSSKVCSYGMFDAFSLEKEPQRYMRYWAMLKLGGGGGGDNRVLGCGTATNSRGEDVGKGEGVLRLGSPNYFHKPFSTFLLKTFKLFGVGKCFVPLGQGFHQFCNGIVEAMRVRPAENSTQFVVD